MDPGLKIAGVTRGWESIVFALKQFRFLIEPFRNDSPFCHSRNLGGNPKAFKYCGPLIKPFRGDE